MSRRDRERINYCLSLVVAALLCSGRPAIAATVSGVLTGYENTAPLGHYELRFENQMTRDLYVARTDAQGRFGAELPPGVYEVRGPRGVVLAHGVIVDNAPVTVGSISDRAPFSPARLFERQAMAPTLLYSPAPSTAPLLTADSTPPPPALVKRKLNPQIAIAGAVNPQSLEANPGAVSFEGNCLGSPCSKQPVPTAPPNPAPQ
ncbi:MAG TPA: hypothetical protein VFB15_14635 [Candidatus Binataceae bacterium]|nr:hypothetical protein [Candidatus Binataceae bacterium]